MSQVKLFKIPDWLFLVAWTTSLMLSILPQLDKSPYHMWALNKLWLTILHSGSCGKIMVLCLLHIVELVGEGGKTCCGHARESAVPAYILSNCSVQEP